MNVTNINRMVTQLEQGMGAEHVKGIYGRLRPVSAAQRLTALAFQIGRDSALEAAVEIALTARLERLAPVGRPLDVQFAPSPPAPVAIRAAASRSAASRPARPQPRA
jgi:hypothetical protein